LGVFAEGVAAVDYYVFFRVQGIRVDQDEGVVWGSGPFQRQLVDYSGEDLVAPGVAPQDQIAVGYIGVGDRGIVLYGRIPAHLGTPEMDGVGFFGFCPVAYGFIHRAAGGINHYEAVHEGIVYRALEVVAFPECY
jgi:hypothetical protein